MGRHPEPPPREDTAPLSEDPHARSPRGSARCLALVLLWANAEPHRVGEVAFLGPLEGPIGEKWTCGRGPEDTPSRLALCRQRPGQLEPTGPIESPAVSAHQLLFTRTAVGIDVACVGQRRLFVNGALCKGAVLAPGDTLLIEGQLLFLVVERDVAMPPLRFFPLAWAGPFGEANRLRMLGESTRLWELLDETAMVAKAKPPNHTLIGGGSGAGKELVARGIHALSDRADRPFVSRSAATITPGLIELELFGNRRGVPNPGTPETTGLIALADGSILFLDEIGEISHDLQARLLRVLDSDGEYQRLGDKEIRRSDLRILAATNRPRDALKHDLVPRLVLRVDVPSLEARREDIPMLLRHILLDIAAKNPGIAGQFVVQRRGRDEPRFDGHLVDVLVRRSHPANIRGLREALWHAIRRSQDGNVLRLTDELVDEPPPANRANEATGGQRVEPARAGLTAEAVTAALQRNRWNIERTWPELGLKDRHVLTRLMKKLGVPGKGK